MTNIEDEARKLIQTFKTMDPYVFANYVGCKIIYMDFGPKILGLSNK